MDNNYLDLYSRYLVHNAGNENRLRNKFMETETYLQCNSTRKTNVTG